MKKAVYTTQEKDEVQLTYIKDFGPEHPETGKSGIVFYSAEEYVRKQGIHGKGEYPDVVQVF